MRKFSKKTAALVVSIALMLCVSVGSTLAYLIDKTESIENTFSAAQVSTYVSERNDSDTKKSVKIQNTGDIKANIRADIVVTWQNDKGEVLAQVPVAGDDYEIKIGNKWEEKDGFYVYKNVDAGYFTEDLIVSCKPLKPAPVKDFNLCVEIIASGIQAEGISGTHPWGIG